MYTLVWLEDTKSGKSHWQDHADYLTSLTLVIDRYSDQPQPLLLIGDFNQQFKSGYAPAGMLERLKSAIGRLTIQTAELRHRGRLTIDHIATTGLRANKLQTINNHQPSGRLSDHFGVVAKLSLNKELTND